MRHHEVVGGGLLDPLLVEEPFHGRDPAVGKPAQAGNVLVGVVVLEVVLRFEVGAVIAAVAETLEADVRAARRGGAEDEVVAFGAAGLVDERRGAEVVGVVKGGLVQQIHGPIEHLQGDHGGLSLIWVSGWVLRLGPRSVLRVRAPVLSGTGFSRG